MAAKQPPGDQMSFKLSTTICFAGKRPKLMDEELTAANVAGGIVHRHSPR